MIINIPKRLYSLLLVHCPIAKYFIFFIDLLQFKLKEK